MKNEEIRKILKNHRNWLGGFPDGFRADLHGADLRGEDLHEVILRNADLREATLWRADLREADLRGADLRGADLWGANFKGANLRGADLNEAEIHGATALYLQCPETGSFTAYKKLKNNAIATLEIPEEAKRSSATTRKCRAEKVRVLKIERDGEEINSEMSAWGGLYEVGKETVADSWDCDRWNACSHGIHFFITKEEAEQW